MPNALFLMFAGTALAIGQCATKVAGERPWPAPVPDFVAPAPGEHPRLLFRKSDVPALRKKAQTPVGRAMVARLRYLLGGGDAMPEEFNRNPPVNIGAKGPRELEPGAFTVNHAAGFGLLYQLTGEPQYADLARQCLEKVFEGQVDRDERYSWHAPGTGFRLSGVHQGVAIAYDLCYDGWDETFRRKVVHEILTNVPQRAAGTSRPMTLEFLAGGGNYPPASNHFGAYLAGAGFAALAVHGDAGADQERLDRILAQVNRSMETVLTRGFGDGGWFGEGTGSDKTAIFPGVAGLMQTMRIAAGKDWMENRPNGRMILLTRALELMPGRDAVHRPARGAYAHGTRFWQVNRDQFRDRGGWSADGLFCIGIGALPERYRPGLAWIYEEFVEPGMRPEDRIYEARIDPLHAVYAFVNWPIDQRSENPTKTFPLAVHDSLHGYVSARNGFRDHEDCLFTGLARRGPLGYHCDRATQEVMVWGLGLRTTMGRLGGQTTHWQPGADGSAIFTMGGVPWAVDYSGAGGVPAVIINVGGHAGRAAASGQARAVPHTLDLGAHTVHMLILSRADSPKPRVEGDRIVLGAQTYATDGKTLTLGVFTPAD